jgi:hypothetical protein
MKRSLIALGAVVLLLIGVFGFANATNADPIVHSGPVPPTPADMPTALPSQVQMQQHQLPQVRHDPQAWGAKAITPPVTDAKVRAEIARRGSDILGMQATNTPTVVSIERITVAEFRQRRKAPVDLNYYAADARIVLVTLAGPFTVPDVDKSIDQAYIMFDAVTGNVLGGGTLN